MSEVHIPFREVGERGSSSSSVCARMRDLGLSVSRIKYSPGPLDDTAQPRALLAYVPRIADRRYRLLSFDQVATYYGTCSARQILNPSPRVSFLT